MAEKFLIGAATAAHQVEGNNIHSDYWVQENLEHSVFREPSGEGVDHYHRYEEDIRYLKDAGLNAYRFSLEWARIEPEEGKFDEEEIAHYKAVIKCCHDNGIEPVVTLHHFSSPAWLISKGGWENPEVVTYFEKYVRRILPEIKEQVRYICTINEANMRIQLGALIKDIMARMQRGDTGNLKEAASNVQVGLNMQSDMQLSMMESAKAFGLSDPRAVATFVSPGSPEGDVLVMKCHEAAKKVIKEVAPEIQVGLTLSLHDFQAYDGGEEQAKKEWEDEFVHYLPYIGEDDFLGVQCYTRKCFDATGNVAAKDAGRTTQMGYEGYAPAITNVLRKVAKEFKGDLIITESGLATDDDAWRCQFLTEVTENVKKCVEEGLPVKGYFCWSLLDNFEWQQGYDMTFGLISVDRKNGMKRTPKKSLSVLGQQAKLFL